MAKFKRITLVKDKQLFFMEEVYRIMLGQVDKFAKLAQNGSCIIYTTKDAPKDKRHLYTEQARELFEDLYGAVSLRWEKG
jgi:hypothetical protein